MYLDEVTVCVGGHKTIPVNGGVSFVLERDEIIYGPYLEMCLVAGSIGNDLLEKGEGPIRYIDKNGNKFVAPAFHAEEMALNPGDPPGSRRWQVWRKETP